MLYLVGTSLNRAATKMLWMWHVVRDMPGGSVVFASPEMGTRAAALLELLMRSPRCLVCFLNDELLRATRAGASRSHLLPTNNRYCHLTQGGRECFLHPVFETRCVVSYFHDSFCNLTNTKGNGHCYLRTA